MSTTPPEKVSVKREVISWILVLVAAFIGATLIQNFVIVNAVIPTGSMISTIEEGDRVIASRLSYTFSEPERGDVIIFLYPDDNETPYVKRLIGMPGETVEIIDGTVYIDGVVLDEPYLTESFTGDFGPYEVPEDSYFMLGDNRDSSIDARYWINTYITDEHILGKVLFTYYPHLDWFNDPDYSLN